MRRYSLKPYGNTRYYDCEEDFIVISTGKAVTYRVELPGYGLQQSVTLKVNQLVEVNFTI
ncbi:hypothetical protein KEJ27_04230 [Candidatus Bathyarchaeota archaeon]|nr:hypothetical protein [Candidatus Bathyarchaeota archaeon]MBS7613193.1 hypothetical protein [Candidatus Bathyarchaeota archaeon]MBS7617133.1 hypothetical protein [Candidatus Bathyarchaeota archaeon]